MIKKRTISDISLILILISILISCELFFPARIDKEEISTTFQTISKPFWGNWVRMDGINDEWYFSDCQVYIDGTIYNASTSSTNEKIIIPGYTIIQKSENMLTVLPDESLEIYLFRKSGALAEISGSVLSSSTSRLSKGLSGIGSINVILSNTNNSTNTIASSSESDGTIEFDGVILNDEYTIQVPAQAGVNEEIKFTLTPGIDEEDIGNLTINDAKQNFKVSYTLSDGDDWGYHYMEQDYDLSIIIENIGSEDMLSADYEITVPSEMNMSGDDFKNILGTVQADGGKITLSYTVSVDSFSDDYKDFKIPILITSVYGDQWDDIVHLRFFRETMSLYIESESNNVQGIVISPDNNSFPFKTNSNSGSIIIPARDCGYLLALSGADYDSETKYALRINDLPEGNGSILISSSVNEPNNTEDNSTIAYMGSDILGYLGVYDLDFYDIRNTEPPIGSPFVTGTSPTTDLTPTWSWTIPTGAVKYRYSFIDGIDWVKTYNNYYTPSLALKTGPYTIFVQAGDASEIWSKSSEFKIRVEADTPSIGSYYDGGYIFYLDGLGGGLMAVECDQGYTNRSTGIELCANLELNGHDDWYLPSKENHRLMYENLYIEEIGDILPECYWSTSTFTSGYYTGYYRFNYGKGYATWDYNYAASSTYWYIRAIREF